ncbi:MAG: hypothetical protein J4428_01295 [Candidatus Aenigmarchaeota archaeon]|nr:hypothetical protein [Candidatus Aenigmarchaeota archaeon]
MRKTAISKNSLAQSSLKDSIYICNQIRDKPTTKAKSLLNDLIEEKRSLSGRYYKTACREILSVLENAEANAESMGLSADKLFIKNAVAHKTFTFMLPKSRWSHRGKRSKLCKLEMIVEER